MKRIIALLLAVLMVLTLCACAKKEKSAAGGWTEKSETNLSDEQKAVFEKAVAGTEYEGYELVALVSTQVVAGTNYKFKCKDADGNEKIVLVYEDLDGNASVTSVE